jgi:hypothetical protein
MSVSCKRVGTGHFGVRVAKKRDFSWMFLSFLAIVFLKNSP